MVDGKYKRIVLVCGSQLAKTELCINLVGYRLDEQPVPIIFVCPSQRLVRKISNRISRMIEKVPSLDMRLAKGKRDSITEKFVGGVRLGFAWSSSAKELCSDPAGLIILDERDRMDNDVEGEGDPVELADARTSTYPDGQLIITSTPTIKGASPIWKLLEEGTFFEWRVPCPKCKVHFAPKLALLKWKEVNGIARDVHLECQSCQHKIEDRHRVEMNQHGRYFAPGQRIENGEMVGEVPEKTVASFWVSGLCSPWKSYEDRAQKFVDAVRSKEPGRVQVCVNTDFGECWEVRGEAPEIEQILELRRSYLMGQIPKDCQVITCGVDVQQDCVYYAIRAWGYRGESWTIDYGVVYGNTEEVQVWEDLQSILDFVYETDDGEIGIRLVCIDAGYRSHMVYMFSRRQVGRYIACKGHDSQTSPVRASKIEFNYKGQSVKGGVVLFHLDEFHFKVLLHSKARLSGDGPGTWHLPCDVQEEYCKQIVAEELVTKSTGGQVWSQVHKDNHWLDCEKLNEMAGDVLNVTKIRKETKAEEVTKIISKGLRLGTD